MIEQPAGPPAYGMKDLVVYIADPVALLTEVGTRLPGRVNDGKYLVPKTPSRTNALGNMLTLVRCMSEQDETDLRSVVAMEVLGTFDEIFADPIKLAKYDSVYDRTPVVDAEGNTHTPPDHFGSFA